MVPSPTRIDTLRTAAVRSDSRAAAASARTRSIVNTCRQRPSMQSGSPTGADFEHPFAPRQAQDLEVARLV